MLNLYRRHVRKCPHRAKGQAYTKCSCPIWCDGELNGKRYRKSLSQSGRVEALAFRRRLQHARRRLSLWHGRLPTRRA